MDAQRIAPVNGVLGRRRKPDAEVVRPRIEAERREVHGGAGQVATPDGEVHPERARANGHLPPDVAVAEERQRASLEAGGFRKLLLAPFAGAQIGDGVGQPAIERQQQANRQLRHGDGIAARAVRNVDTARRRGLDVNRVVAGACPDDEGERTLIHHLGRHLRRANDQHVGLTVLQRGDQRLVAELCVIDDLAAGLLQAVEAGRLELVGDEDKHDGCGLMVDGFGLAQNS